MLLIPPVAAATKRLRNEGGAEASGGSFSIYIGEPENPLIPGNTNETEGGQVIDSLFTGLVQYNPETNEADFNGVAESIESEDHDDLDRHAEGRLDLPRRHPGHRESFVEAWNYTANSPNAQGGLVLLRQHRGLRPGSAEGNRPATRPPRR